MAVLRPAGRLCHEMDMPLFPSPMGSFPILVFSQPPKGGHQATHCHPNQEEEEGLYLTWAQA